MLNSFFDKFIFTNNLKYRHNNFYLVKMPFLIVPTALIASLAETEDKNLQHTIYTTLKETTQKKLIGQFTLDPKLPKEKSLKILEDFFTASGWGGIKNVDVDEPGKRAIVIITNAHTSDRKITSPIHFMLRGILAGIFSDYFGASMDCIESECIATGNPHCKFILKKSGSFDPSKKETQEQIPA